MDDVTEGSIAEELTDLRQRLYGHYGSSAITKAADELGIDRTRISHVLSRSGVEIIDDLESLLRQKK